MATHTDEELALLGVLATGFESRQQQTNGLHIGETAGRRAHAMVLDLQRRVEDCRGTGHRAGRDPAGWSTQRARPPGDRPGSCAGGVARRAAAPVAERLMPPADAFGGLPPPWP